MYKGIGIFSLISVVVGIGFAVTLAIKIPEAAATESFASTGSHVISTESLSPIKLDPSQEAYCKRATTAARIHRKSCAWAKRLLALMSAEPRDSVWAEKMESDLRRWVESLASGGFTLRNVECRSSWCVLEVGSTQAGTIEMSLRDANKKKLFDPIEDLVAPDIDNPNIQDQVVFYKRFCRSTKELLDDNGHMVPNFYTVDRGC